MIYKYTWRVVYENGDVINQFDGEREVMWRDVDIDAVVDIYWIDSVGDDAAHVHVGNGHVEMCRRNHIAYGSTTPILIEYLIGRDGEYINRLV